MHNLIIINHAIDFATIFTLVYSYMVPIYWNVK